MYRVITKIGNATRLREFDSKVAAFKYYNHAKRNGMRAWFKDLTITPETEQVKTITKILNLLDKINGQHQRF